MYAAQYNPVHTIYIKLKLKFDETLLTLTSFKALIFSIVLCLKLLVTPHQTYFKIH